MGKLITAVTGFMLLTLGVGWAENTVVDVVAIVNNEAITSYQLEQKIEALQRGPSQHEDLIRDVSASVIAAPDTDPGHIALPFFSWVASLPFGDDPATSQVTAWTEQQIEGGSGGPLRIVAFVPS